MPRNIFDNKILTSLSIPMCIVDQNGKVLKANEHIGDVFLYDGLEGSDFFVLTGIKLNLTGESNSKHVIERNGKTFQLLIMESPESNDEYVIIFKDISDY